MKCQCCGAFAQPDAHHCEACGEASWLADESQPSQPMQRGRRKNKTNAADSAADNEG